MPPHHIAVHVGAVGEMQHYVFCPVALGRVAAQTVTAIATPIGKNAIAMKIPMTSVLRSRPDIRINSSKTARNTVTFSTAVAAGADGPPMWGRKKLVARINSSTTESP